MISGSELCERCLWCEVSDESVHGRVAVSSKGERMR